MKVNEIINEDLSRRGFLKGLAGAGIAAAGLGASGKAKAYNQFGAETPEGNKAYFQALMQGAGQDRAVQIADRVDKQVLASRQQSISMDTGKAVKLGVLFAILYKEDWLNKDDANKIIQLIKRKYNSEADNKQLIQLVQTLKQELSQKSALERAQISGQVMQMKDTIISTLEQL